MAQIIKHRRGTVAELANYSGLQKGELGVTTGSVAGLTTPVLHLGDGSGNEYPVGRLIIGTSPPNISSYGQYNNMLFHDTDGQALYRLHSSGNDKLDLTGNIINRTMTGSLHIGAGYDVSGSYTSTGSFGTIRAFDPAGINITAIGSVSGSSTSTGSFGRVEVATINATTLSGDGSGLTGVADAVAISGSWQGELSSSSTTVVGGGVSGSSSSTGSFGKVNADGSLVVGSGYTSSPDAKLQVLNDAAASTDGNLIAKFGSSYSGGTTGFGGYIDFTDPDGTAVGRIRSYTDSGNNIGFDFGTWNYSLQEGSLHIKGDGNVGIGTQTPDFKLHVVGDAYITGNISSSANLYVSSIRAIGDVTAERFVVSSSVSHFTQSFSSGSTIFGDSGLDTHRFTGSLYIGSGSLETVQHISASGDISSSLASTGSFGSIHISGSGDNWFAGNTGFGTTEPDTIFHVHDTPAINGYAKFSNGRNTKVVTIGGDDAYVQSWNGALLLNWAGSGTHGTAAQDVNIAQNALIVTHNSDADGPKITSAGNVIITSGSLSGSSSSTGSFGLMRMNGKDLPQLNGTGSSVHIGHGAGAVEQPQANGNIFVGFEAGNDTTTGHSNIAIGHKAYDEGIASTDYNIAIGRDALGGSHAGSGADRVVAIGTAAAYGAINNVTGMVAIGYESLYAVTTGNRNTALGYQSGNSLETGADNVFLGYDADGSGTAATNQIVIGKGVTGTGDNQTVIGNSSQTHVVFGGDALISGSSSSTGSFGVIKSMSTLGYSLFNNQVYVNKDGSASSPSINVIPQGGNGLYKYASNEIGVATNATATARFSSTAGLEMLVGNVSGSATSTGSFGHVMFTTSEGTIDGGIF